MSKVAALDNDLDIFTIYVSTSHPVIFAARIDQYTTSVFKEHSVLTL